MKQRNVVMALLLAIGLMMIPQTGRAGMVSLSEEQLSGVTAQGGITLQTESLNLNTTIEMLAYGDRDGLGAGTGTAAGYLSLGGIALKCAAQFATPQTVEIVTAGNGLGLVGLTGLSMTLAGMTISMDRFSIDAIRLGSQPQTGNSLGSIYLSNMVTSITGKVQVSQH